MPLAICLLKRSQFWWEKWHSAFQGAHNITQIESVQSHPKTMAFEIVWKANTTEREKGKLEMRYAQQKQRLMDNLLWKTPDTWLLFVTYDYTHSVALFVKV